METPKDRSYKLCTVEISGKRYHELAFYTKGGEVEFEDEDENQPELWDDEKEVSFLGEGWYNECENCERYNKVDVASWSELPNLN